MHSASLPPLGKPPPVSTCVGGEFRVNDVRAILSNSKDGPAAEHRSIRPVFGIQHLSVVLGQAGLRPSVRRGPAGVGQVSSTGNRFFETT